MYILKEIACEKDEIEANDRLLKFCVTFEKPGTVIVQGVSKVTHGFHFFLKNAIYDIGGCNLEDEMYMI